MVSTERLFVITVRMSAHEKRELEEIAEADRVTVSDVIRQFVKRESETRRKKK